MILKVMTYNIKDGFRNRNDGWQLQPERRDAAIEVVSKNRPDILVLTEAVFGSPVEGMVGGVTDYSDIFSYSHSAHAGVLNQPWSVAVLSDFPIFGDENRSSSHGSLETENLSFSEAMRVKIDLERVVEDPKKKTLTLDAIHPSADISEAERWAFIQQAALKDMEAPYLLAGDSNSISHRDAYNFKKLHEALDDYFPGLVDDWQNFTVSRGLEEIGLFDTFLYAHKHEDPFLGRGCTVPTNLITESRNGATRLDVIWGSRDIADTRSSYAVGADKDNLSYEAAQKASDHLPLLSILNL